jgi:ATP-dependent DNA helicase RecG
MKGGAKKLRPFLSPIVEFSIRVACIRNKIRLFDESRLSMVDTVNITRQQLTELKRRNENHFFDFKSKEISPNKLTKVISAFQNADGGEVWVGLSDPERSEGLWAGYKNEEAANGVIQALEETFGIGNYLHAEFVTCPGESGLVLHIESEKSHVVSKASDGVAYLRRGAQSLPCKDEALKRLELSKGIVSQESSTIKIDPRDLINSDITEEFVRSVVPSTTAEH